MSKFGWCLPGGNHTDCPGSHPISATNSHGTHIACDCKHHEGEEAMGNSGPAKARAYRPTAADIESGDAQPTTEVILEITDVKTDETLFIETTFAGAHAARDALASLLHEHASRSIVQKLEDELDQVMVRLMDDYMPTSEEDRGWARGLGTAISLMRGCDMDAVREAALARYENSGDE